MAGQGAIIATGAIGYPRGISQRERTVAAAARRFASDADDQHLRSPRHSRRAVRRISAPRRRAAARHATDFYESDLRVARLASAPVPQVALAPRRVARTRRARPSDEMLRAVAAGMAIVSAYRRHGHLAANLDPLGAEPVGDASLEPQTYGLTPALQSAIPAACCASRCRATRSPRCLPRPQRDVQLDDRVRDRAHLQREPARLAARLHRVGATTRSSILARSARSSFSQRLTQVEAFDRYVRKTFLGQKTFSGEGLDVMVPMLEEMLDMLADDGVARCGARHGASRPPQRDRPRREPAVRRSHDRVRSGAIPRQLGDDDVMGDVKYHHGATGTFTTSKGKTIDVDARAQSEPPRSGRPGRRGKRARAADRSFARPSPLQDRKRRGADPHSRRRGLYRSRHRLGSLQPAVAARATKPAARIHLIANNQIGFTTDPLDARSTRYASDLAKGFDVPIVHVNADDVDACIAAVHLAVDFRRDVRPRRADRSHRLSSLRPQRDRTSRRTRSRRWRADQEPSDRARALREQAGRTQGVLTAEQARRDGRTKRRSDSKKRAGGQGRAGIAHPRPQARRAATPSTEPCCRRSIVRRCSHGATR